ncbi:uncharacterized protein LOC111278927 isoform X2 [Durio zibethinus]|uniref:Uncharacterized protein LOC111278927 isoform X2 n=1 Tax=Durio zibethinus TaxID=66656 RepID=A0A6P5WZB1_DURZI|nr:uncharacterized protein LOC111278927 isoform X2 [Durio zibethinus]
MFDLLMKRKFYAKCKSAIRTNKVRLETIKKKRNAMEKFLKNDIAELLRNGLDYNAYGRAEGLLVDQNRTACYDFIEQFSECISKHVSVMQKQSECPEECREAIPSLIYAAARFADLPELRDLRTIFTEKYGNSLESYLNQEFVQKLKGEPPTKEMKLQLIYDIAQEFSIEWDSKALEQKLFKPPPSEQLYITFLQNEAQHKSLNGADDDGFKLYGSKNDTSQKSNNHDDDENELTNMHEYRRPKRNETDLTSHGRKEDTDDKDKLHSSSESEVTDQDIPKTSSTSVESVSEDGVENWKPFNYRFIPPPYVRSSLGKERSSLLEPTTPSGNTDNEKNNKTNDSAGESKPKPRSVRRRPLKPPPGREGLSSFGNDGAASISPTAVHHKEARKGLASLQMEESDQRDEEEKTMDGRLMHYSQKKSLYEWVSKWKANLAPPSGRQTAEDTKGGSSFQSTKSDPSSPGGAATSPTEKARRHTGASSFQADIFARHVHPKLPEYDDLEAIVCFR